MEVDVLRLAHVVEVGALGAVRFASAMELDLIVVMIRRGIDLRPDDRTLEITPTIDRDPGLPCGEDRRLQGEVEDDTGTVNGIAILGGQTSSLTYGPPRRS